MEHHEVPNPTPWALSLSYLPPLIRFLENTNKVAHTWLRKHPSAAIAPGCKSTEWIHTNRQEKGNYLPPERGNHTRKEQKKERKPSWLLEKVIKIIRPTFLKLMIWEYNHVRKTIWNMEQQRNNWVFFQYSPRLHFPLPGPFKSC